MNNTNTGIAKIYFDEKASILHVEVKSEALMDLQNLREHYQKIKQITKGKKHLALVDVTNPYVIFTEGLEYAASNEALENRVATAYCNPPLQNRLNIVNLSRRLESKIPVNIFPTKEEALHWLKDLKLQ